MPARKVPHYVRKFARESRLATRQLRWCEARACRTIAFAIDDYQRAALDRHGFRRLCPSCGGAGR